MRPYGLLHGHAWETRDTAKELRTDYRISARPYQVAKRGSCRDFNVQR